jgi:acyl carrier protein
MHKAWLKAWFKNKGAAIPDGAEGRNYLEMGLIDSFGFLELMLSIEKEYGIKFSDIHLQDKRFVTVDGLAEIINEVSGKK